ncbi:MAG: FAD-dependent thymidylate synthase [Desulfamplus sp.]|nr:FAD-dependent thymidylate synthase [Desulfamplus sp.]
MKIIEPSFEILAFPDSIELLEIAGRTCYRSEPKGEPEKFVKKIMDSQHLSVIEHLTTTVRIITDRGVLAELTRHRLASFSVESTRYCNYSQDKYGNEITFIKPCFWQEYNDKYKLWVQAMANAEATYLLMIKNGATPEQARSVLPNSLKTEIIISCNLRELRHILDLRCSAKAHPQIKEICLPLLKEVSL